MAIITKEELLPLFGYSGTVDVVTPPVGATSIIRTIDAWSVQFNWTTTGPLNFLMSGNWHLQVLLEQIGPGEFALPGGTAIEPFVAAPNAYSKAINFAAGSVPVGLYQVAVIITMKGPAPANHPGPITGYAELGLLEFYDAG